MIGFLKRLREDRRGNVLVIAGASLPLLVGAAGLATDTINWALWKRQLQRAADSAAVAGVYTRVNTDTQAAVKAAVAEDLTLNHHTGIALRSGMPVVELLSDDGTKRRPVRVTLEVEKSLPFSSMFLSTPPVIRATATAASVPGAAEYCVVALDPSAAVVGIEVAGSTDLDMGDCSLIANSKNPNKAASNGSNSVDGGQGSTVKARSLAAAGGVQQSSNWTVDSYDPYSTPVDDPFKDRPIPSKSDCSETITVKKQDFPIDRSATDTGKIVCISGGLTVQGTAKLGSGTYVIDAGDLVMNSTGSSLSCTGCTIILTNSSNPAQTGSIKITGGALDITAPTDGTYKGMAIYQDARATDDGKKGQNHINGNNAGGVQGAIYIPNQSVLYNGGGNLTSMCMQLVGKRVELSGSSKIKISSECAAFGLSPIGSGGDSARRVRLIS